MRKTNELPPGAAKGRVQTMPMTQRLFVVLIWAFAAASGAAARAQGEPMLEKVDLFEGGVDGYALYRIPGIVVTRQGTVLAYCEARRTGKSDWDTIDILLRRSTDGGRTFGPPRKIVDVPGKKTKNPVALAQKLANEDDVTYNNPVAIVDAGVVHFLFCLEYMRCFYMRSDDDGRTFSPPVEITAAFEPFRSQYDWHVLAVGPGHGIQLTSGRLVVPVWLSTGTGGHAHRPSVTTVIYSDDQGARGAQARLPSEMRIRLSIPTRPSWCSSPMAGRYLNVRSESHAHRRLVTTSRDGATGWSKAEFDDQLLEPICMASIVRLSQRPASDKNRIVFTNPHNLSRADGDETPGKSRDRKNISIKLSYDEAQTWPVNKPLEPGMSGYSDLASLADGTILCFYERGSVDGKTRTKFLTLARFNLEWLTDEKDTFK